MATPTGLGKLIFADGQQVGCVAGSPLESASERIADAWRKRRAKPGRAITVTITYQSRCGSLPRPRGPLRIA